MVLHSIRWQLQLWHGLILVAVLLGFGFTAHRLQRANELRRVDLELQKRLGPLLEALRGPPPGERGSTGRPGEPRPRAAQPVERARPEPPVGRDPPGDLPRPREIRLGPGRGALFEGDDNPFYYVIWGRDGSLLKRSSPRSTETPRPESGKARGLVPAIRMFGADRQVYQFTPPGDCILVGRSLGPELANLRQLGLWLTGLGGGVLLLGLAGGWWLATRAIQPIADISAAAARISEKDLSHRINSQSTANELGQLATVLNSTFARLESAFERQQRFTADASHELRTPVAVILSQTQTALARERSGADYRETLEACERAAQRMRRLTESLLRLARLDGGTEAQAHAAIDLSEIARESVALLQPLADERQLRIQCEFGPAQGIGDADQMTQAVTNLLVNAIQHNVPRGEVRVTTRRDSEVIALTVTNTGRAIPAEELPRIFERFYRSDESRAGTTGGNGLGLAITKAIVDAHAGSIEVESTPGDGTVFTIRLPLRPLDASQSEGYPSPS